MSPNGKQVGFMERGRGRLVKELPHHGFDGAFAVASTVPPVCRGLPHRQDGKADVNGSSYSNVCGGGRITPAGRGPDRRMAAP